MLTVINENGEIVGNIKDGDRIIRYSSIKSYNNIVDSIISSGYFIKVYCHALDKLVKEDLNSSDFKVLLVCLKCYNYNTGLISNARGKELSANDFVDCSFLKRSAVYKSLNNLVSKGIIAKVKTLKNIKYYGNPFIFMKGKKINKTLYDMFKKTKWL